MKRTSPQTFEDALRYLLYDLCVEWGFCLPPDEAERIALVQHWNADDFALAVLRAEGFPVPESEKKWRRRLRQRFRVLFGEEMSVETYVPEHLRHSHVSGQEWPGGGQ